MEYITSAIKDRISVLSSVVYAGMMVLRIAGKMISPTSGGYAVSEYALPS